MVGADFGVDCAGFEESHHFDNVSVCGVFPVVDEVCFGHEECGGEPVCFAFLRGAGGLIIAVWWGAGFVAEDV